MPTLKQKIGAWLIPRLPLNPVVFRLLRLELKAAWVNGLNALHPRYLARRRRLARGRNLLVNIGCGPFGHDGWINFDLHAHPKVALAVDCRRSLPLADDSCRGIHVEHYFEHLEPTKEQPRFLTECRRCLMPGGILRIVVPDARKYAEAYVADGWADLNAIGCGGEYPETAFATKMAALNHVFLQDGEHYGGIDAVLLRETLVAAGFGDTRTVSWREGAFPEGCIDREQHRFYSLYMEARK
jgi:predicted SAM-dependent methyltransferase